ncbi:hypothetical protein JCM17380_07150 [Desulfosporosinus burensis]
MRLEFLGALLLLMLYAIIRYTLKKYCYDNGGGAFFIPYLFALLTAGIPLLILEFTMGHKYRGSAPLSYARMHKKTEWIGWWQVAIAFVISTYYSVIIAWIKRMVNLNKKY